jgi:hypothetical protein
VGNGSDQQGVDGFSYLFLRFYVAGADAGISKIGLFFYNKIELIQGFKMSLGS